MFYMLFVSNAINFLCTVLVLNAQIRVAERPMTKQGLTGMRTAAGRGQARNSYQHVSALFYTSTPVQLTLRTVIASSKCPIIG